MFCLTKNLNRLVAFAQFSELCHLPSNKAAIEKVMAALMTEDPELLTPDSFAFFQRFEDLCGDYEHRDRHELTEFELMVWLLREIFKETLEARTIKEKEFPKLMHLYGIPKLGGENYRGELIWSLFDKILKSVSVSVNVLPKDKIDADVYIEQHTARRTKRGQTAMKTLAQCQVD